MTMKIAVLPGDGIGPEITAKLEASVGEGDVAGEGREPAADRAQVVLRVELPEDGAGRVPGDLDPQIITNTLASTNHVGAAGTVLTSTEQVRLAVSGEFDYLALLHAESTARLDALLDEIGAFEGVLKTTTSGGVTVGPVLMGTAASAHILTPAATVRARSEAIASGRRFAGVRVSGWRRPSHSVVMAANRI